MINFTSRTKYFLKSTPTDMRKGYEGLASIVREVMNRNPRNYNEAFVFYSKDYRKVTHELSKETLILILSTSVQTKIRI